MAYELLLMVVAQSIDIRLDCLAFPTEAPSTGICSLVTVVPSGHWESKPFPIVKIAIFQVSCYYKHDLSDKYDKVQAVKAPFVKLSY